MEVNQKAKESSHHHVIGGRQQRRAMAYREVKLITSERTRTAQSLVLVVVARHSTSSASQKDLSFLIGIGSNVNFMISFVGKMALHFETKSFKYWWYHDANNSREWLTCVNV
mmetsp:Transcript_14345/g.29740  ORF Transcript_14345/g.29740 Transcript_14345/m.29740 type:complete len:112 (-) Transcript_14345:86-421(-)